MIKKFVTKIIDFILNNLNGCKIGWSDKKGVKK